MKQYKTVLPEFPKTLHLPWSPNPGHGDSVAALRDVEILKSLDHRVFIEEKIDGASVGLMWDGEHPVVRNKDHILQKGYLRKKQDTVAKMQFRPLWNWMYEHKKQFRDLEGYSVYAQWMLVQHGMVYDKLPDWIIAHDLFDQEQGKWVAPDKARCLLVRAGFSIPDLRTDHVETMVSDDYIAMANLSSRYTTTEAAEGIYVKVVKGDWIVARFKMVRMDFVQGKLWSDEELKKNHVN